MDAEVRIEEMIAQVRAAGGRATTARRAILQTLIDHHDVHPTVEHITAAVQVSQPDVAESTVYRFLDELVRLGLVESVRLGHGPAVYHFTMTTHHHHLVCNNCGKVTEVPQKIFDSLGKSILRDFAFEIEPRHFTLSGRCRRCEQAPAGAHSRSDRHTHPHPHPHPRPPTRPGHSAR